MSFEDTPEVCLPSLLAFNSHPQRRTSTIPSPPPSHALPRDPSHPQHGRGPREEGWGQRMDHSRGTGPQCSTCIPGWRSFWPLGLSPSDLAVTPPRHLATPPRWCSKWNCSYSSSINSTRRSPRASQSTTCARAAFTQQTPERWSPLPSPCTPHNHGLSLALLTQMRQGARYHFGSDSASSCALLYPSLAKPEDQGFSCCCPQHPQPPQNRSREPPTPSPTPDPDPQTANQD